jgi:glutamate N-acetyltransferase / amino-acid N-acetyltransferase
MSAPDPTIYLPKGFSFSAVTAGIKTSGRPDLALIESFPNTTAAALFTRNRVVAAPVLIGRSVMRTSHGRVQAVIVNSGNANCATGATGKRACERVCREAARLLGVSADHVFPSSTGIIGVTFPTDNVLRNLPELVTGRQSTTQALYNFAEAIMTTDTKLKIASERIDTGSQQISLVGVAKGSGMIHPQLATMLVYLLTDAIASPAELRKLLKAACDDSFNCMSVDGDTSTNDTVLLLASGQSEADLKISAIRKRFQTALQNVCQSLSDQIVADGEGVKHVIRFEIAQARNRVEALRIARAIAHSLLVKTALAGSDPNWGRILSAIGSSGIAVDPQRISVSIGDELVCRRGARCGFNVDNAHRALSQPRCTIQIRLGRGSATAVFTTGDLTEEYIRINASYST